MTMQRKAREQVGTSSILQAGKALVANRRFTKALSSNATDMLCGKELENYAKLDTDDRELLKLHFFKDATKESVDKVQSLCGMGSTASMDGKLNVSTVTSTEGDMQIERRLHMTRKDAGPYSFSFTHSRISLVTDKAVTPMDSDSLKSAFAQALQDLRKVLAMIRPRCNDAVPSFDEIKKGLYAFKDRVQTKIDADTWSGQQVLYKSSICRNLSFSIFVRKQSENGVSISVSVGQKLPSLGVYSSPTQGV